MPVHSIGMINPKQSRIWDSQYIVTVFSLELPLQRDEDKDPRQGNPYTGSLSFDTCVRTHSRWRMAPIATWQGMLNN